MSLIGLVWGLVFLPALIAGVGSRLLPGRAVGLVAGWLAATLWLTGLPPFPPSTTTQRLPYLALVALLPWPLGPVGGALVWAAATLTVVSWAYGRMALPVLALQLGLGMGVGAALAWSARRGSRWIVPLVSGLGALCLGSTGNAILGMSAGGLAVASAAAIGAGVPRPVAAGVTGVLLGALLEAGRHTGQLSPFAEGALLLALFAGGMPRPWGLLVGLATGLAALGLCLIG